jgi:hypothetical protein
MAAKKTERINVWLTLEQIAWLKAKGNTSETMRALVTEAMNLDRLKESVRRGGRGKKAGASRTRSR